jgi:LysR family glycine cleavage system transcriptional activator
MAPALRPLARLRRPSTPPKGHPPSRKRSVPLMRHQIPPFKSIEAFVAAGQALSFTEAARILYVTLPAISRRIRSLETELGVRLFRRTHRAVALTPLGEAYLLKLMPAIHALNDASDSIRAKRGRQSVRLSVSQSFAASWLLPRLPRLHKQHPELGIELHSSPDYVDLYLDTVDVAIRLGQGTWPDLHASPLMEPRIFTVYSPAYFRAPTSAKSLHDLSLHTLLGSSHLPEMWPRWLSAAGAAGPLAATSLNFDNLQLLYEAAANGLGVAMGIDAVVHPYLADGRLVRAFDVEAKLGKAYYVVCRALDRHDPSIRVFSAWLRAEAASANLSLVATSTQPRQSSIVMPLAAS